MFTRKRTFSGGPPIGFRGDTLHLKGPVSRHFFLISLPSRFSATTALDPEFAPCFTETTRDDIPRHVYSDIFTGEVSRPKPQEDKPMAVGSDMNLPLGLSFSQLSDLLVQNDADPFAVQTTVSSSHWVPSTTVAKVEVSPGVWEEVLVVLLAKNSHQSKAPNSLLNNRQIIHWFVRYWDTLVNKKKVSGNSVPVHVEVESERVTGASCDISLLRGRLRRRTRRLSKGTGIPVYQIADLAAIPRVSSSGEDFLNNPSRGRLRRRMRRLDTSGAPSITVPIKTLRCPATSTAFFQGLPGTFAREWNLNSEILGDKAAALLRNQIDIAISLRSIPLQSSHGEGDFSLGKKLKPLIKLTAYPYPIAPSEGGHECKEYVWLQQKEETVPSGCKDRAIVALIEDYVGLVDSSREKFLEYAYISSVTAEQSVPELHAALSLDSYWKRLSFLVMGNSRSRYLPYAKGYGISHYRPKVPRKNFRYGVYNVDTLDKTASAPSWRAAWSFQQPQQIPDTESEVCQHDFTDFNVGEGAKHYLTRGWFRTFPDPPYFLHWAHEFFRHPGLRVFQETLKPRRIGDPYETLKHDVTKMRGPFHRLGKGDNNITIQTARKPRETENRLDLRFFRSFKYLMGLGTTKNIQRGLNLVVQAARHGCLRSRGMVKRLFKLYGHGLDINDDTLRHWLLQGALHGSLIALQDLEECYPDSEEHQLAQEQARFCFALTWPGSLNYQQHVHPVVDLGNTALINMLITDTHVPQGEASHLLKTVWIGENRPDGYNGVYKFGGLLHMACLFGFAEAVNPLLGAGMEVNSTNSSRTLLTPLLCALRRGHYKIAKTLIERGADCRPDLGYPARELDWPSPLHYLVYIQDGHEAMSLAETLVARGADVNWMCPANLLEACEIWPLGNSLSVTPLRWAILHGKAQLARKLVQLGARFASASFHEKSGWENETRTRKCLLLEAPCTNCDILLLYFKQLALYDLPPEFARTPLGLLVSEDDTPHRRLRLGFGDMDQIITALDLLLTLQPGYEDAVLWSAIRHGHLAIIRHLIEGKGWSIETRYLGLNCLHSAILYGHKEVVSFLLERGANPTAVTDCRRLTALHLLALVPRDKETDMDILELLLDSGIPIDAAESCSGLTALHISVRNRKLHMVQALLDQGANPLIPVTDQIDLLSEGRSGLFRDYGPKQHKIVEDTTILGEVLLQCNQDAYYSLQYAEKLLRILLAHATTTPPSFFYIDHAKSLTILHIIALLPFAHPTRVFRFVLRRFPETSINVTDSNGDTPLHYSCLSWQINNLRALLKLGANATIRNHHDMNPAELTFFGALILGPLVLGFKPRERYTDDHQLEQQARKRVATAETFQETLATLKAQGVVVADTQYHPLRDLFSAMCPMQTHGSPATYSIRPLDSLSVSNSNNLPEGDESMHYFDPPKREEGVFLQPMDGTRFISGTDDR